ncbi:MAG: tRNA threonylcarbamoyladenosine dehydratase [Eggerthellaceae bacterium]|nr:tRNA threonylcarbamoyladenosine dehydratase [Eggerthellaceae bacterium]
MGVNLFCRHGDVGLSVLCPRRYLVEDSKSRLRRILGEEGLAKLEGSTVVVFGLGGVGGSCAEALVRGGIGHLAFVDGDRVCLSNLNRQAIAFQSTIGQTKVDAMCAMARDIYPDVQVEGLVTFVLPENLDEVMGGLPEKIDYIVDAIDTLSAKLAIAQYAQERGIPVISSMGAANKTDPTKLRFADLFKTDHCPLCRAMRKQARAKGLKKLQVLYSSEEPISVAHEEGAARSERTNLGTMSYMPPVMGQMIAGYVIQELLKND